MDNMSKYDEAMKFMAYKVVRNAETRHKRLLRNPPSLADYATLECNRGTPRLTLEGWNNELKRWFENVMHSEMELRDAKKNSTEYVILPKRKVIDIRDADQAIDPDTKIVVIEGEERGQFWTFDEAKWNSFGLMNEVEYDDTV